MCYMGHGCGVLFFKQKTAYELRISDWSSDVCSSDLRPSYAGLHDAMADDSLGRSAQAARCFAAVEPLVVAEVARHRVGLAADRQVEPVGDAIVAGRRAF